MCSNRKEIFMILHKKKVAVLNSIEELKNAVLRMHFVQAAKNSIFSRFVIIFKVLFVYCFTHSLRASGQKEFSIFHFKKG